MFAKRSERKYSLSEIDRMRAELTRRRDFISVDASVEDELRTHMLNGTAPEELYGAADRAEDRSILDNLLEIKAKRPDAAVTAYNSRGELLEA